MNDTEKKFSGITVSLHWIVAIVFIGMLAVGIYMHETKAYGLYDIHKSVGITLFLFVLVRVAWRIKNGWPVPVSTYAAIEQLMAKVVHWVLIIGTVVMPISGMMMSAGGGHGLAVFGLELLATNPDPLDSTKVIPLNEAIGGLGHTIHGVLAKVMIAAIVLHIAGALKHHMVDKDGTLRRMLGAHVD